MPNWDHVLREIQKERDDPGGDTAPDKIRKKYLQELHKKSGRNIICYYSGWLSKPRNIEGLEINDEDTNGFMLCTHGKGIVSTKNPPAFLPAGQVGRVTVGTVTSDGD